MSFKRKKFLKMTEKTKIDDSMIVKPHWRRWPILFLYAAYAFLNAFQVSIKKNLKGPGQVSFYLPVTGRRWGNEYFLTYLTLL